MINSSNFNHPERSEKQKTETIKCSPSTSALSDYATASDISDFLKKREKVYETNLQTLALHGIVVQDDISCYLHHPSYNSSALKEILKTPLHFYYKQESKWKQKLEKNQKEKNSFSLSSFLHTCLLNPAKFSTILVEPKVNRSTLEGLDILIRFWEKKVLNLPTGKELLRKAHFFIRRKNLNPGKYDGKKIYLEKLKQLSGHIAVTATQKIIIDAVKFNYNRYGGGILPQLLKGAQKEVSMYYTEPTNGIPLRIRPDALQFAENIGHNAVIWIESTTCESLSHFYYRSVRYTDEFSKGMYLDVVEAITGRTFTCAISIMLQTIPPFGVAALVWNAEDLERGKTKYRQALQSIANYRINPSYTGYEVYAQTGHLGFIDMKQPIWAKEEK